MLSLVVSIATLSLGYIAYQKLLVQEAKKEQLKLVLQLIAIISESEFDVTFLRNGNDSNFRSYHRVNFFTLNTKINIGDAYYEVFYAPDYVLDFEKLYHLLSNPLIPRAISASFLSNNSLVTSKSLLDEKEFFILGTPKEGVAFPEYASRKIDGGMERFLRDARVITFNVKYWLEKSGVSDINFNAFGEFSSPDINSYYP